MRLIVGENGIRKVGDEMDREMVISGLEHCKIGDCVGCPYDPIREESLHGKHDKWELVCNEQLTEDIIAMLKEQDAVTIKRTKENVFGVYGGTCPKCRNWIQSVHSFVDSADRR